MPTRIRLNQAEAARVFHALSDETRLAILDLLGNGEQCVCELMEPLHAAQSRLSFHLRVLKNAGLIRDRPEGRWVFYALNDQVLDALQEVVQDLKRGTGKKSHTSCS